MVSSLNPYVRRQTVSLRMRLVVSLVSLVVVFSLAACEKDDTIDRVGKDIEKATEETKKSLKDLGDKLKKD
jgi:predicted small secreted protein